MIHNRMSFQMIFIDYHFSTLDELFNFLQKINFMLTTVIFSLICNIIDSLSEAIAIEPNYLNQSVSLVEILAAVVRRLQPVVR